MRLDLTVRANFDVGLDLDKSADTCAISDLAAIKIGQIRMVDDDVFTQDNGVGDRHQFNPWAESEVLRPSTTMACSSCVMPLKSGRMRCVRLTFSDRSNPS
ncbi:hypothetical protein D3C80_1922530 [compost metagenome]